MSKGRCRHCRKLKILPAKGLCYPCYTRPSIAKMYAPAKRGPRKQTGDMSRFSPNRKWHKQGRMPESPTQYAPGSDEKMEVMRQRVERGEMPHHPKDARSR